MLQLKKIPKISCLLILLCCSYLKLWSCNENEVPRIRPATHEQINTRLNNLLVVAASTGCMAGYVTYALAKRNNTPKPIAMLLSATSVLTASGYTFHKNLKDVFRRAD